MSANIAESIASKTKQKKSLLQVTVFQSVFIYQ